MGVVVLIGLVMTACLPSSPIPILPSGSGGGLNAPTSPPVTWCETGLPTSPYTTAPAGAVTIPAGDDSTTAIAQDHTVQPNTTYWFAPGTHTLGTGEYSQINVAPGDTFVGAPGAIIDGQGKNDYAFTASGTESSPANATIEYLTVQYFTAGGGEAVVGQGNHNGWTVQDNYIENNPDGAGILIESNDLVQNNCLQFNGEYGFNGGGAAPADNATLTANDIYDNNNLHAFDFPTSPSNNQCGCSGGGKWWNSVNDTTTNNYIHDNQGVGVWVDTDNAGQLISGNYISNSWDEGIIYEISYNAQITDNTLVGNNWGEVQTNAAPSFAVGAIYINSSGGDSRVASNYSGQLLISGNVLTQNWGEIIVFHDSNRVCGFSADDACTLVNPALYTLSSCKANINASSTPSQNPDYYDNCQWKTQNVSVTGNTVSFNPSTLPNVISGGESCASANSNGDTLCGYMGLFSYYGSVAPFTGTVVDTAVSDNQHNVFANNTYSGPVGFDGFNWSIR